MKKLEHELDTFRGRLIEMGNLTERMVRQATAALQDPSQTDLTNKMIVEEDRLDRLQLEIDREAIRLLTVYSPVAGDLRMVMSITRITSELERIGDHTVNMGESLNLMRSHDHPELLSDILKMASVVSGMVHDALDAFVQSDISKAQMTIAGDNIVDALNDRVVGHLLSLETVRDVLDGATDISGALGQMLIARSLERIADQATNICEEVVYMVKGRDIRHPSLTGNLAH